MHQNVNRNRQDVNMSYKDEIKILSSEKKTVTGQTNIIDHFLTRAHIKATLCDSPPSSGEKVACDHPFLSIPISF